MAAYTELHIDQGTDFSYNIAVVDAQTNANVNIASYVITSQMRKSFYSVNATAELTCTLHDTTNGIFSISLTAANTANIKPGRYLFDVKYDTGSSVRRALEGYITINPQVTK